MRDLSSCLSKSFWRINEVTEQLTKGLGKLSRASLKFIKPQLEQKAQRFQTAELCLSFASVNHDRGNGAELNRARGNGPGEPNNGRPKLDYPNDVDTVLLGSAAIGGMILTLSMLSHAFWGYPLEVIKEPVTVGAATIIVGGIGALGRLFWCALKSMR